MSALLGSPTSAVSSRMHWGTLVAMVLARITFGYQIQTVASLGPQLQSAYGIEFALLGTLMGLMQLPGIIAAIPSGFLARRFGDRDVIVAGMVLMCSVRSRRNLAPKCNACRCRRCFDQIWPPVFPG